MRASLLTIGTWTLGSILAVAAQPSLQDMGIPFGGKNVEVLWEAPTNHLPRALSVFKVLPTLFSPQVVSNMLNLAGLREPQKAQAQFASVSQGKDAFFTEPETKKYLSFSPARAAKAPARALPDLFRHLAARFPHQ